MDFSKEMEIGDVYRIRNNIVYQFCLFLRCIEDIKLF